MKCADGATGRLVVTHAVVLLTSFAVGCGARHPMYRGGGHRDAENALRAGGLPWTVVRPTRGEADATAS